MTVYYYRGFRTDLLKTIIRKVEEYLIRDEHEFNLKNGDTIQIYGTVDDALLVDSNDYETEIKDRYELAIRILQLAK